MLSALVLYVAPHDVCILRCFGGGSPLRAAFVATLPLVFTTACVHSYALYPPRQLALTLAFAAIWAIDGGADREVDKSARWLALGGLLYGLALSADPYPLVLAPVIFGYALMVSWPRFFARMFALIGGFAIGIAPLVRMRTSGHANDGPLGLSLHVIGHNASLLWNECLPWALSYRVYTAHDPSHYVPWEAPAPVQAIQLTGAFLLGALVISGAGAVRDKNLSWPVRRLGFIGALGWPITLAGFLVSVMVMDHFSMRYLAVLTLLLPFAALPAARMLRFVRFTGVLAPHLVSAAICGWLGYGPFVHGVVPVVELPELRDDYTLFDSLKSRGIKYAEADYWTSYRLTLLSPRSASSSADEPERGSLPAVSTRLRRRAGVRVRLRQGTLTRRRYPSRASARGGQRARRTSRDRLVDGLRRHAKMIINPCRGRRRRSLSSRPCERRPLGGGRCSAAWWRCGDRSSARCCGPRRGQQEDDATRLAGGQTADCSWRSSWNAKGMPRSGKKANL